MSDDDKGQGQNFSAIDLVTSAIKGGAKVVTGARDAWRSPGAKRIRQGLREVVGGLRGVTRFVRSNTIRGLLLGELIITEKELNSWFSRVEKPDGVSRMTLRCRPSRLVLSMVYERRLLGLRVASADIDLPFEIVEVHIDRGHAEVRLRLDHRATSSQRGILQQLVLRLLSRAASDLLDRRSQLDTIDDFSDIIDRDGDLIVIDLSDFPPFRELMNRELRLIGGRRVFPFRAVRINHVHVEEGRLVIRTRLEPEAIALVDQDELPEDGHVPIQIIEKPDPA